MSAYSNVQVTLPRYYTYITRTLKSQTVMHCYQFSLHQIIPQYLIYNKDRIFVECLYYFLYFYR